jgi:hypothetical protein
VLEAVIAPVTPRVPPIVVAPVELMLSASNAPATSTLYVDAGVITRLTPAPPVIDYVVTARLELRRSDAVASRRAVADKS